jgi:hypothetical protein
METKNKRRILLTALIIAGIAAVGIAASDMAHQLTYWKLATVTACNDGVICFMPENELSQVQPAMSCFKSDPVLQARYCPGIPVPTVAASQSVQAFCPDAIVCMAGSCFKGDADLMLKYCQETLQNGKWTFKAPWITPTPTLKKK